jgi:hypothetical protein
VVETEDADTSTAVDADATYSDDNCNVADNEYTVMLLQSSRRMPMVMIMLVLYIPDNAGRLYSSYSCLRESSRVLRYSLY